MDTEPIAVGLKFGFLAVLYLFLLWVGRSALKELRQTATPAPEATGFHQAQAGGGRAPSTDASLVAMKGGGLEPDTRYDLFGGLTIGRDDGCRRSDRRQVRLRRSTAGMLFARTRAYYVEDMGSTNGTYLNGGQLRSEATLSDLDEIRIGDTELRFEMDVWSRCPCESPRRHTRPTRAASARLTRTPTSSAARSSPWQTAWAAPRRARSPRGWPLRRSSPQSAAPSRRSRSCARSPRARTARSTPSHSTTPPARAWARRSPPLWSTATRSRSATSATAAHTFSATAS